MSPAFRIPAVFLLVCLGSGCGGSSKGRPLPPEAPSGLLAVTVSASRIDLLWTDNSDRENTTAIERSVDNVVFVEIAQVSLNIVAYQDTGLAEGTTYYYRLRTVNAGGMSPYSPTAVGSTLGQAWIAEPGVVSAPGPRAYAAAVYDPVGLRMLLFGGYDDLDFHSDVWALDLSNQDLSGPPAALWTPLSPGGTAPSPRIGAAAVYDPVHHRVVLFGGLDGGGYLNDVHVLSLSGPGAPFWTAAAASGSVPVPRHSASAVYDPLRREMVVYGGEGVSGEFSDTRILSLPAGTTFAWRNPGLVSGPVKRTRHVAVWDALEDRMLIFGGLDNDSGDGSLMSREVWMLRTEAPAAWTNLTPSVSPPFMMEARGVLDPINRRLLVFPGNDTAYSGPYGTTLWAFELDGMPRWTQVSPAAPFGGRGNAAAVYDELHRRLVVYGGDDENFTVHEDLWWIPL